jgi:methionine-rich copper-binding protein CopC
MTVGRVLVGALVTAGLVVWPSVPTQAHTRAVASWPAVGEVVTAAPERVTVLFAGDPLSEVTVSVAGPDGSPVADGEPLLDGLIVSQALAAVDEPGTYTATIEGIASDLHTVTGTIAFVVDPDGVATGNPTGAPPELGLPSAEPAPVDREPEARDDDTGSTGTSLLLTGLAGALLLAVLIRLASRRRTSRPR